MVVHLKSKGMPLSFKAWAQYPGVLCKTFWNRLKPLHPLSGMQRKHRASSTELDRAEKAAREAMLRAIQETRAAEEERKAELVKLRYDIMLRWYASDEYRKTDGIKKRRRKKTKHRTSGHKDGKTDRKH